MKYFSIILRNLIKKIINYYNSVVENITIMHTKLESEGIRFYT